MTSRLKPLDKVVDKIEQEIRNRTLVLDSPGDEQSLRLDAARITRRFLVERFKRNEEYIPTVDEIRSYSIIYARALELLKQGEK